MQELSQDKQRFAMRRTMVLMAVAILAGLVAMWSSLAPGSQAEAATSIKITDPIPLTGVPYPGYVFFTTTFSVSYSGGTVLLSADSGGTGDVVVDDEIVVTVTGPDSTVQTFAFGYDGPGRGDPACTGIQPSPPHDITHLFGLGTNQVTVELRDTCGVVYRSSAFWLVLTAAPTPSPSPSPTPPAAVGGIVEIQASGSGSALQSAADSSGGSSGGHYSALGGAVVAGAVAAAAGGWYARRRWVR